MFEPSFGGGVEDCPVEAPALRSSLGKSKLLSPRGLKDRHNLKTPYCHAGSLIGTVPSANVLRLGGGYLDKLPIREESFQAAFFAVGTDLEICLVFIVDCESS